MKEKQRGRVFVSPVGTILCGIVCLALSVSSCAVVTSGHEDKDDLTWVYGGIERGAVDEKKFALVFTGGSYAEGGIHILNVLDKHSAKASFFFTGHFLDNADFQPIIKRIVSEGHYLGAHSDEHPLYCPWDDRTKTLVTEQEFKTDMRASLKKIKRFGVDVEKDNYWIPPYEWYNDDISRWSNEMGMILINFTPGTYSNADYTGEVDRNFRSSDFIYNKILEKEENDPHGLNGFLLLMHIGAGAGRKDKFFLRLDDLLTELESRGYTFVRVDELLDPIMKPSE